MNKNTQILTAVANSNREFTDFREENAIDLPLSSLEQEELAEQMLNVLAEDSQYASQVSLLKSSSSKSIGVDVAVLVTVTFLLRTHVKISRNDEGKWSLLVEHKPNDSKTLEALLNRLSSIMKF